MVGFNSVYTIWNIFNMVGFFSVQNSGKWLDCSFVSLISEVLWPVCGLSEFEKCYKLSENIQLASLLSYWTLEPSSSHLLPLDTQSLIVIYHLIDKIILNQHRSSLPGPVISVRSEPGLTGYWGRSHVRSTQTGLGCVLPFYFCQLSCWQLPKTSDFLPGKKIRNPGSKFKWFFSTLKKRFRAFVDKV